MKKFKNEYNEVAKKIDGQNTVAKHNDLVRKIRLSLSEAEQKTVIYAVSKIKSTDKATDWVQFDIKSYCKACGIDEDNGNNYRRIRALVKSLRDKSQEVFIGGEYTAISWFEKYRVNPQQGFIKVLFDSRLEESLYGLQRDFVAYKLEMALPLEGKYTVALYEMFKSYLGTRKIYDTTIKTETLRERLGIDQLKTYKRFNDIKRKILEPALEEINKKTDIFVQWTPVKVGRGGKIEVVRFDISKAYKDDLIDGQRGIEDYQ